MQDPNIICIVLDTVRQDHLSPYGYERETTPFLDSLSDRAQRYTQATAPAPWTLPVHASLFTGQYPSEHGALQEQPYLDTRSTTTLAAALSDAGYATASYSANAWISPYTSLTHGFDDTDNFFGALPNTLFDGPLARLWELVNSNSYLKKGAQQLVKLGNRLYEQETTAEQESYTPRALASAKSFIDQQEAPYFVFLNLLDAHLPYVPPLDHVQQFIDIDDRPDTCQNSKAFNAGARDIDAEEWRLIEGLYDGALHYLDRQLEQFVDWLDAAGELDNTLVVICADHGELFGEHDLFGHEFGLYDPLVNVPLFIYHPDLAPTVDDSIVELHDLYHTLLDAADVRTDQFVPQRSLLRETYRQDATDGLRYPESAFIEYSRPVVELEQLRAKATAAGESIADESRFTSRMQAVRTADQKLIQHEHIGDEFYVLADGPAETENRLDTHAAADALATQLAENPRIRMLAREASAEAGIDEMDDAIAGRLQDLGYLD